MREDGTVKVLDFGLAKALDPHPEGDPSQSPTLTAAATQMGVIMGTAAYMSPEQARGKTVDRRADIWAFGAVLYEMLIGRRAFKGEDVSLTLSAVLQREPALDALPEAVPPVLHAFLHRCFEKDPRQRTRDIGDLRLAMDGAFETTAHAASPPAPPARLQPWQRPLPATVAALGLVFMTALAVWIGIRPTDTGRTSYLELALPTATSETGIFVNHIEISADGRHIVVDTGTGRGNFAISDTGVLAYLTGPDELDRTMVKIWTDGRREPLTDERRRYTGALRISPDSRQLGMNMFPAVGGGGYDVWVYDMERDRFPSPRTG